MPFRLGLATAVIIQIEIEIPVITPTVYGGYAKNNARSIAGIRAISIQSAPRLLFLVNLIEKNKPADMRSKVITDKLIGALRYSPLGIPSK